MLEFAKHLSNELVFDAPSVTNRHELFQFVADQLKQKGIIANPDLITQKLDEREAEGPTSVGDGIAIPHIMLGDFSKIHIAIVRLSEPMDWEALDRQPVNLAFFIFAPEAEKTAYIRVLGSLATRLHRKTTSPLSIGMPMLLASMALRPR